MEEKKLTAEECKGLSTSAYHAVIDAVAEYSFLDLKDKLKELGVSNRYAGEFASLLTSVRKRELYCEDRNGVRYGEDEIADRLFLGLEEWIDAADENREWICRD